MNNHPYVILWISVLTSEPAIETFPTLELALERLASFRKHYPKNYYFLYNRLHTEGDKQ